MTTVTLNQDAPTTTRKVMGVLRIAIGLAMIYSIGWQIQDRLANNLFRPSEYFAYFTIDSSMIAAVTLVVSGIYALRHQHDTRLITIVQLCVFSAAVVVSVVYNALLRGMANDVRDGNYAWPVLPNEILHVWGPIFIVLEWLIIVGSAKLNYKTIWWVIAFPLLWLVFSIARGAITGWWAYWFINPNDPGGLSQMFEYIFGIMAFFLINATVAIALQQLVRKLFAK
ncbi:MAG: Pr6Pr family membrane protein [Micrococcales bacterium]